MSAMRQVSNIVKNQTEPSDKPIHSWYQFVLGYPPHFVRYCITKFDITREVLVLDPFCGTGTTNVECKRLGIDSLGLEANPMAHFAACVKTNWEVSAEELAGTARQVASAALCSFKKFGLAEECPLSQDVQLTSVKNEIGLLSKEPSLTPEQMQILPKDFISKTPLRKILILKELILRVSEVDLRNALLLALADVTVNDASNLAFGPEIYTAKKKRDAPVVRSFLVKTSHLSKDLMSKPVNYGSALIRLGDARRMTDYFDHRGVGCVITSPPYPNEKDYTRITRLESIVLGFMQDRKSLRAIKANLLRSNSRNIFISDTDGQFVKDIPSINRLADEIERKRLSLGKTSGFEKMYHQIVRHYFGGMFRHFASLKGLLAPNARLAYVVGDQMSFFRINIATAKLLGEIAERLNYEVEGIELWRNRLATATKATLDENILFLRNSS